MSRNARTPSARTLLVLTLAAFPHGAAATSEIPPSLREIVLGAGHRPIVELRLGGATFHGLARFSDIPYVLWPAEPAGPSYDRDEAAAWIRRSAAELGHRDFEPRYVETTGWRGNEVWDYELVRQGVALHDARVSLHWRDRRFIGLVNAVPVPIQSVEDLPPSDVDAKDYVYTPRRGEVGYALRLARVLRETDPDRRSTSLVVLGETVRHIVEPLETRAVQEGTFEEWLVPAGNFPDQIDIDSAGVVWFSQPSQNWVTSFDPATEAFTHYNTIGGTTPDGLTVTGDDVLWTGLYDGGGLGQFDIATSEFTALGAPYAPVSMAIPSETTGGTLWVTDHQHNKVSEFEPVSGGWLQSLTMPTPNCWVVAGAEDPASLDVYFTEYNADQLGRKISGGPIVDIDAPPGSGPAFAVHSGDFIYFSEWQQARLAAYEISSGTLTEYAFPVPGENGGPIDVTPGGLIVVGTRNVGYIMVFDPASMSFDAYPIPTAASGLKDGLRVDGAGSIWFTESGPANRIAVLHLGPSPPTAQFAGNPTAGVAPLTVAFSDLSSDSPTTWSWSFGDRSTSDLPNPSHEYADPGVYTVSLAASNDLGSDVESKLDYIKVIPPCPLATPDLFISGKWQSPYVVFTWQPNANCLWAVHRATDPTDILETPPIETNPLPIYRDHSPPEPLVFYNVEPTNKEPAAP